MSQYRFWFILTFDLNSMKNKLPKKKIVQKLQKQQEQEENIKEEAEEVEEERNFIPKMLKKQSLFVTFNGRLQRGYLDSDEPITAHYSIVNGPDWIRVAGEKQARSQIASSNGRHITWNLPFQISFQTTYLTGWPQLIVTLYGTDFFGRLFVRGYGNIHLPTQTGNHIRKIRIFKPLPQSIISGIFGYIGGTVSQYKDPEKILASGDGREVTRVKSIGEVTLHVATMKHNFKKYGYE